MPITTWKIMLRRADQQRYHYVATHQRGGAPVVGEQIELVVDGRTINWNVVEIFKGHSTREDRGFHR